MENNKLLKKASIEQGIHNSHQKTTKTVRVAGIIAAILLLSCVLALLPQSAQASTLTDTINVGNGVGGIAVTPNGQYVYSTNRFDGTVSVISTLSNTVIDTITVGGNPIGVAVTPNGEYVYVTNYYDNTVSVIATATNTVNATITGFNYPEGVAIAPNGELVYITNSNGNTISVISTATNTVTATITGLNYPEDVVVAPDGGSIYVKTNYDGVSVLVISTATNTVTATINLAGDPYFENGVGGIAVAPNGECIYVTNNDWSNGNSVSVISTATNTVTATINLGGWSGPEEGGSGVAVAPNGEYLYATNNDWMSGGYWLSVISTTTNTITENVSLGEMYDPLGGAGCVAVTPNGEYIYAANGGWDSSSISVISVTSPSTYTITVAQGDYGTISPGTTTVNYGGSQEFTFSPATGYHLTDVLMNGTSVMEDVENGAYTVSDVTGTTTLTATCAIDTFSITVAQGDYGTISPGTTTVNYGGSQEFTFSPATGYHLTDVLMNGTSVMEDVENGAYTVSDVTGTTTLTATCAIDTFSITVAQGDYGTISPGTTTVNYGGSQEFTFSPATGYHLTDVLMNGTSVMEDVENGAYTVSDVTGTTTLTATCAIDTFSITVAQGDYGTISPGTTTVNYGGSQEFTITPHMGYHISSLVVDGSAVPIALTFTFSNVQDDHSITASFTTNTLTATVTTTFETYPVEISGNITTEQFSNMTITPYQDTKITSVDFTLTGPNGTEGFCNLTLPKIAIPFGTNPVVYIDGIVVENQSFTEDFDNFYITYTTHFSIHQIEILFTTEPDQTLIPIPITTWAPSQTSNTSPNPTTIPTPTISPTPTATPRPTTNPTSAPATMLATMGQYVTIAAAIIILGAVIIGLMQRRKHSTKAPLK